MKKFKITVNGKSYEVVEEVGGDPGSSGCTGNQYPHQQLGTTDTDCPAAPVQSPAPAVGGPIPDGAITVKA